MSSRTAWLMARSFMHGVSRQRQYRSASSGSLGWHTADSLLSFVRSARLDLPCSAGQIFLLGFLHPICVWVQSDGRVRGFVSIGVPFAIDIALTNKSFKLLPVSLSEFVKGFSPAALVLDSWHANLLPVALGTVDFTC